MQLDLENFIQTHYSPQETILLACSTWPDSIFLLYELLKTSHKDRIVGCYFNHKIRPEADEEERFLEDLGKNLWFKVEIGIWDIKQIRDSLYPSISLEELARKKRYQFFAALWEIYQTKKIMTAHHLDDKIETFFFNLARGSKLTWLINMTQNYGNIMRPLLHIEKSDILNHLNENNIKYCIDTTNFENIYSRNHIRNNIIPQFYTLNREFKTHIKNTLHYFQEVKNYIDNEVESFLGWYDDTYFSKKDFFNKNPFLQKEILRYIFYITNHHSTIGLSEANIWEMIKFMNWKWNKTIKEIKALSMRKDGDRIWYESKKNL